VRLEPILKRAAGPRLAERALAALQFATPAGGSPLRDICPLRNNLVQVKDGY
jgi:hypothetical protein